MYQNSQTYTPKSGIFDAYNLILDITQKEGMDINRGEKERDEGERGNGKEQFHVNLTKLWKSLAIPENF